MHLLIGLNYLLRAFFKGSHDILAEVSIKIEFLLNLYHLQGIFYINQLQICLEMAIFYYLRVRLYIKSFPENW